MKKFILLTLLIVSALALPSKQQGRVWNGENARPGQAPYMIGLLWYEFESTIQPLNFCGGAILNNWWVITVSVAVHPLMKF